MMAKQVFLSIILILCILKVCEGYYWYWYTTERMKKKVTFLSRELVLEATRNYQRIDHIKEYYASSPVWDVGQMLYYIRSKYARMVRLYILAIENDKKYYNFHLHLPALKEIHHLGMDIYNLVEMLEEYEVPEDMNPMEKSKLMKKKKAEMELQKNLTKTSQNIDPASSGGTSLRKRPINKLSFKNQGFYARKPIRPLRSRMNANTQRDIGAKFDSDTE